MGPAKQICLRCGRVARSSARFCGSCGVALPSAGAPFPPGAALSLPDGPFQGGTLLGQQGRYRVERLLGRGGFGEAYLAHDTQLDRPCVVKRLALDPNWNEQDRLLMVRT